MNIDFPAIDETFIKGKVTGGYYTNATELVRDAVRRMREADDSKIVRLARALEAGEADIAAGRTAPYTPELLAGIEKEARRRARKGRKPNPDVAA